MSSTIFKIKQVIYLSIKKSLLNSLGIKEVCSHLVYVKDINENSIIVDAGANQGHFAHYFFKHYSAKCFSIEPNELFFDQISLSSQLFQVALAGKSGERMFHLSENMEASSLSKDFQEKWSTTKTITLKCLCWKDFLEYANLAGKMVDILKIDIEGAELEFIKSLEENDLVQIKQITIEFHDWLNPNLEKDTLMVIEKLSKNFWKIESDKSHCEVLFINKAFYPEFPYNSVRFLLFKKLVHTD